MQHPLGGRVMGAIISFIFFIVGALLTLMIWAMIVAAVLSWLIAFDILNMRNVWVYRLSRFLDQVTRPVLAPFQRFIPLLGGVDISPIIAILVLVGIRGILLPAAESGLHRILG
jgi:YggT family protein